MVGVQVLRIHDPERRPASWAEIIRPGQFVAFAAPSDGTCVLFDSLHEGRVYCQAAVLSSPKLRYDLFDTDGRAQPPLESYVHPSRAAALDTHPGAAHRRRVIAWSLIAAALPLLVFAARRISQIEAIFPGVIGVNLLLGAGRLLWLNLGVRESERARQDRLNRIDT
jgi:hypothetical protein